MTTYTLSHPAYLKLILHAAKHPHARVNGVLLGNAVGAGKVVVTDVVPLLHHWTELSPMMEVALSMVEAYASSTNPPSSIVGYYEAPSRVDDKMLSAAGSRVAAKLAQKSKDVVAVVVDNAALFSSSRPPLIPLSASPPHANLPASTIALANTSSPSLALVAMRNGDHELVADFDDSLEDTSKDWLANRDLELVEGGR